MIHSAINSIIPAGVNPADKCSETNTEKQSIIQVSYVDPFAFNQMDTQISPGVYSISVNGPLPKRKQGLQVTHIIFSNGICITTEMSQENITDIFYISKSDTRKDILNFVKNIYNYCQDVNLNVISRSKVADLIPIWKTKFESKVYPEIEAECDRDSNTDDDLLKTCLEYAEQVKRDGLGEFNPDLAESDLVIISDAINESPNTH